MIIRKLEALFTLNVNRAQFNEAFSGLKKLEERAQTVMNTVAGYWAVQAFHNFVSGMSQIGKTASYLGVSTDALQELRYAAEKSGLSIDALEDSMKELQVRSVEAASGEGEAAEAFAKLGHLKSTDATGRIREPLELLDEIANRLQTLPDQADRLWVGDAIFGDEGSKIIMMLKQGADGLKKLREEARRTGRVLDNETIVQADRLTLAMHRLKDASVNSALHMSAPAFAPLARTFEWISTAMERVNNLSISKTSSSMVKTGFLGSLAFAATKATQALLPFAPAIKGALLLGGKIALRGSGIGLALLLLQDMWSMFNQAESVTGIFAQAMNSGLNKAGQFITNFYQVASSSLKQGFTEAFANINQQFDKFSQWFTSGLARFAQKAKEIIASMVPDFLKDGFVATMGKILPKPISEDRRHSLAPNINQPRNFTSTNHVNVAVNVKSNSDPTEIGSEVSKAINEAFERERFNTYMGVMHYAG
jgi:hypothetical protein